MLPLGVTVTIKIVVSVLPKLSVVTTHTVAISLPDKLLLLNVKQPTSFTTHVP